MTLCSQTVCRNPQIKERTKEDSYHPGPEGGPYEGNENQERGVPPEVQIPQPYVGDDGGSSSSSSSCSPSNSSDSSNQPSSDPSSQPSSDPLSQHSSDLSNQPSTNGTLDDPDDPNGSGFVSLAGHSVSTPTTTTARCFGLNPYSVDINLLDVQGSKLYHTTRKAREESDK